MRPLTTTFLGLTRYRDTWDLQKALFERRVGGSTGDLLLLNEHLPVYTFGKSGDDDHLLAAAPELEEKGVDVVHIDRGGDVTFHGPGQLVGYPIIRLEGDRADVHKYLRDLEEVIIRTLADLGVAGVRDEGYTGVWVGSNKIAAIGVKVSHWTTMHGFALNVNTDLSYFDRIIPCGIFHKGVTSLEQVLGRPIRVQDVVERLIANYCRVFEFEPAAVPPQTVWELAGLRQPAVSVLS